MEGGLINPPKYPYLFPMREWSSRFNGGGINQSPEAILGPPRIGIHQRFNGGGINQSPEGQWRHFVRT